MNYISDLDMCATTGIIGYDAVSFVRGDKPRYIGAPQFASNNTDLSPNVQPQPPKDVFNPNKISDKANKSFNWKALILGTIAVITTLFLGKKAINLIKNFKLSSITTPIKNNCLKVTNYVKTKFKNAWATIKGWFPKGSTPPATPPAP